MSGYPPLLAPVVAFLIGLVALRAIRRIALAVGFVDSPDRRRKLHEAPIPLGGGLAVWLAAWIGWGIGLLCRSEVTGEAIAGGLSHAALATASLLVLVVGLIDDRYGLRGCHKLTGQMIAAAILVGLGLRIDVFSGFGVQVPLGIFAGPITILWVVLVVNAFNLIDGMDGFCGSVGLVVALAIAFLGWWSGRAEDAFLGLAIAGALAAFLTDNLPPARIYLGDAGSLTLGMMFATLTIRACSDGPGTAVALPPLVALLALPLLDVVTALGRRWLTGHSLFTPDRGHIHHRLRIRLGSTVAALGAAVGLTAIGACGATLARAWGIGDGVAGLAVVTCVVLLVGTNTFGGSELRLLLFRLKTTAARFFKGGSEGPGAIQHECHLLGVRDWAGVWDALIRAVEGEGVRRIELAIDLPAVGETYHGLWSFPTAPEGQPNWSVVHSLHVGGNHAGTLRVAGSLDATRGRYLDKVEELVRILEAQLETEAWPLPFAKAPLRSLGLSRMEFHNNPHDVGFLAEVPERPDSFVRAESLPGLRAELRSALADPLGPRSAPLSPSEPIGGYSDTALFVSV